MVKIGQARHLRLSSDVIAELHKGFSFKKKIELSASQGFADLHDAVLEAFSVIDLEQAKRDEVNALINALQNITETLAEQEAVDRDASGYYIEAEDLRDLVNNIGPLGEAIRIHQTGLQHHEIATALLWSKTALQKILRAN